MRYKIFKNGNNYNDDRLYNLMTLVTIAIRKGKEKKLDPPRTSLATSLANCKRRRISIDIHHIDILQCTSDNSST